MQQPEADDVPACPKCQRAIPAAASSLPLSFDGPILACASCRTHFLIREIVWKPR